MSLSAIVVARDAERIIGPALRNLRHFADELVLIVDEATVDDTAWVAADMVETISPLIVRTWPVAGSYEHVLNEASALCRGDWILLAHDDELWPAPIQAEIRTLTNCGSGSWAFPRRHLVGDGSQYITGAPLWPDYQVRLRHRLDWQRQPWPRQVHASPIPTAYGVAAIWHLKFLVKPPELRAQRLQAWGALWAPALSDHYRRFSMVEGYDYQVAGVPEAAPEELAAMLAGGRT